MLTRTQATNGGDDITQFEITTAAAFLAFAEHPADVLLLEVGLGGRLDATNVVERPALNVITPISHRPCRQAGRHAAEDRREKAGILKRGVPAVIAQQEPEAEDVIRAEALRVGAPLIVWGEHFDAYEQRGRLVVQRRSCCSICRAGARSAAIRSSTPAPPSPRRCSLLPTCRNSVSTSAPSSRG